MIKLKPFIFLLTSAFIISCGAAPKATTTTNGPITECVDNNCFEVKKQKVEAIMNHRQILPSFQKCLALQDSQISAGAKTAFKDSINTFSLNGAPNDVSAPLMMALMTVASEMCLSRIVVELPQTSGRLYFPGFNLAVSGGNTNTQTLNLNKTIQDLAKSCWGREIKPVELTLINSHIVGQSDRAAALYACSAVLASTQAIRF